MPHVSLESFAVLVELVFLRSVVRSLASGCNLGRVVGIRNCWLSLVSCDLWFRIGDRRGFASSFFGMLCVEFQTWILWKGLYHTCYVRFFKI